MLTDWIHWISLLPAERLVVVFAGVQLIDGPRYALLQFLVCLYDYFVSLSRWLRGSPDTSSYDYCPAVCVISANSKPQMNSIP